MSRPKDVLLLGAYGLAGEAILRALVGTGVSVTAAGRNEHKLLAAIQGVKERVPGADVQSAVFDPQDANALRSELSETRVVINAVGPYLDHGEAIAKKAIETTTHYIDIASKQVHYRKVKELSADAASAGAGWWAAANGSVLRV
tara:strand:- start:623 stop:1054 length:432 start_codon:yes stop_codon:yes gene_type:complete